MQANRIGSIGLALLMDIARQLRFLRHAAWCYPLLMQCPGRYGHQLPERDAQFEPDPSKVLAHAQLNRHQAGNMA
jgi:hypothetical protein